MHIGIFCWIKLQMLFRVSRMLNKCRIFLLLHFCLVKRSTRQELYNLYRKRRGIYRRHSTHRLDAVHSPVQTVQEIIALLEL